MPVRQSAAPKASVPAVQGPDASPVQEPAVSNALQAEQVGPAPEEDTWLGGLTGTPGRDAADRRTQRDRRDAQADLASRFQLLPDGYEGPHAPHQVTRAQFEQIAALYSDIRRGRTGIEFENQGSGMRAGAFRDAVMGDMADLLTTEQGRALLSQIAGDREHTTTIGWSPVAEGASAIIGPGGNAQHAVDGTGTNAGVVYQPGVDLDLARMGSAWEGEGYRHMTSDVALFHELVHANHARTGTLDGTFDANTGALDRPAIGNREALVPNDRGVAREEYATVGLGRHGGPFTENGYRAERARVTGQAIPRRGNYNGGGR